MFDVSFSPSAKNRGGDLILKNTINGETKIIASNQSNGVGRPAIFRNGGYIVFGAGSRLDGRFQSSGIFARFSKITRCRFCTQ